MSGLFRLSTRQIAVYCPATVGQLVFQVDELVAAGRNSEAKRIVVRGEVSNVPSVRPAPGQTLCGEDEHSSIAFADGFDGVQMSTDNEISTLRLLASPTQRAIFNDTSVASLGRMRLAGITPTGQVQILARDAIKSGHIDVDGLDIVAADARTTERPHGFGV